jgi:hypothetical protein
MANFTITSNDEFTGATVIFDDGTVQTIAGDNQNYKKVIEGLLAGDLTDDELLQLISPFELVYRTLTKLSERVSRKGMKLRFDGDVIDNALTKHIIAIMDGGGSENEWSAYVRFMEKLYTNPSKQSQEHLFHFIEKNGLLLTPDGDAVFYKGTQRDGKSTRAGYGIVNGVEFENDYLQNEVGTVVEIPRSMVDDNRGVACSVGLHVGDFSYASGFGSGKLFTVIVNPRDVVSVPSDNQDRKVRVARYVVVEENTARVKYDGTIKVFTPAEPEVKAEELPKVEVTTTPVTAKAATSTAGAGSRVEEYKTLIRNGGAGKNLRRYRNKRVTSGRRQEFDEAVRQLGLQY